MALIRSAALRGFRAIVAELGGDPVAIALSAGLPVEALDSADLVVSDADVSRTLELAAIELDCPDFGLQLGRRQDVSLLGPLGLAIQHSSTLADALENVTSYLFVHAEGLRLTVQERRQGSAEHGPDVVEVCYDAGPGRTPGVQGTGLVLGYAHRVALQLVGGPYGLRSVDLPHAAPDRASYEAHFGVPIREGRPCAMLRVTGSLSSIPVLSRDDELQRLAVAMLARHRRAPGDDVVEAVRTYLVAAMGTSPLTVSAVASSLSIHPRTLQRLLANAGTTFGHVLDDLRRQTARQLLISSSVPIAQVAQRIGYAEAATFSRRAQGWWGLTPLDVRRGTQLS
ncbi:AraC family transcriptional regulator [Nocardioides sp. 616]|uniref:AraC family transcriptional regulator n=1 Tax=Nocardioides sp. 616 TaxID=2268090 RepID=UPI000CE5631D|nr:AraC family transcriptional regulator [Nocardioides sp. 616]